MVRHCGTLGLLPVEVKEKHLKHFGTSQCHPTCQHCKACERRGISRGHMEFPGKINNQQEALVTGEETGVVGTLARASSGTQSPYRSSVRGRSSIREGGLIIGLPWLDGISSVTTGISWGFLLSASHEPTGGTAASAHLGTHTHTNTTHSSLRQAFGDFILFLSRANDQFPSWQIVVTLCAV